MTDQELLILIKNTLGKVLIAIQEAVKTNDGTGLELLSRVYQRISSGSFND